MALHSPVEFAQIVDTYVGGWRKLSWMPECRAQGGASTDQAATTLLPSLQ